MDMHTGLIIFSVIMIITVAMVLLDRLLQFLGWFFSEYEFCLPGLVSRLDRTQGQAGTTGEEVKGLAGVFFCQNQSPPPSEPEGSIMHLIGPSGEHARFIELACVRCGDVALFSEHEEIAAVSRHRCTVCNSCGFKINRCAA